ncbi:MAG: hypothetical protein Q9184_003407 [Pyrenodesmia sp. 2 TL-2023]
MVGSSILILNLLLPIALLVFASGFFPYKAVLPGHTYFNAEEEEEFAQHAPFEKVIFMVVDALRRLIRSGSAIPFTAHATAPTITMPRIKAMTTGSVPSFLDVILNFAESEKTSSLETQDTWLAQLQAKRGGRLVLYGDDTWLKLFPNMFTRADGTSSFFVSDFTDVDLNVTRNVPAELENDDWNGMVLHYLGLDHIGHKSGPNSPHMFPKQVEMDGIIKSIYHTLESHSHMESTLLVLCGDHGMNEVGNHGGSSEGETSPALLFISPKMRSISRGLECPISVPKGTFEYYEKVEQSDIAPTLAALLGFPIPKNNLGVAIPSLLLLFGSDKRIQIIEQNTKQFIGVLQQMFPRAVFDANLQADACADGSNDGLRLACLWSRRQAFDDDHEIQNKDDKYAALHMSFLKTAQSIMSNSASNYSTKKLYCGIIIVAVVALWAYGILAPIPLKQAKVGLWFMLMTLAYGAMMFASSYVEEEHQFWYLLASAWLWCLGMKQYGDATYTVVRDKGSRLSRSRNSLWSIMSAVVPLTIMRITRAWNQTGQKHAGELDIARGWLQAHSFFLWSFVCIAYAVVATNMPPEGLALIARWVSSTFAALLCLAAMMFKVAFTMADAPELLRGLPLLQHGILEYGDLMTQARAVFAGMLVFCVGICSSGQMGSSSTRSEGDYAMRGKQVLHNRKETITNHLTSLHAVVTLFLITQSRVTNIPLFALFELQMRAIASMDLSPTELSLTSIILQNTSFFAFGGSNAISSIDLSNGYNGVSAYNGVLQLGWANMVDIWNDDTISAGSG